MSTQTKVGTARAPMPDTRNAPTQPIPAMPMEARSGQEMSPGMMATAARGTETKPAVKSTEFYIFLIAVGGVLAAAQLTGRNAAGNDVFPADQAWWYIALLSIGYFISRGLAKAGSAWRQSGDRNR